MKKNSFGFIPHRLNRQKQYDQKSNIFSSCDWSSGAGFTLIEFLIVVVVIGSIGLVIVGILSASLRGTNKTNIVNLVRQNGNQAIIQMTKTIEFGKFEGVSVDGINFNPDCFNQVPTPSPTPPSTKYKYLKITAIDGGKITYSCGASSIASNSAPLINTNSVVLVQDQCWFTCGQERLTTNTIIGIKFQLKQKAQAAFVENTASIPFETSVTFRNQVK